MPKKVAENVVVQLFHLPPNMAKSGWDFDTDVLRDFCAKFGLKWDISFRFTSGRGTLGGANVKRNADGSERHHITISQIHSREKSVKTLLHELCHCIQREKIGNHEEFMAQYRLYSSGAYSERYLANPFEKEAREFAENNCEKWDGLLY